MSFSSTCICSRGLNSGMPTTIALLRACIHSLMRFRASPAVVAVPGSLTNFVRPLSSSSPPGAT
eukprot:6885511-Prorocentrum_lima.AAC.1